VGVILSYLPLNHATPKAITAASRVLTKMAKVSKVHIMSTTLNVVVGA